MKYTKHKLEDLFHSVDVPWIEKLERAPAMGERLGAEVAQTFYEEEFIPAVRYIGSLQERKTVKTRLFYFKEPTGQSALALYRVKTK